MVVGGGGITQLAGESKPTAFVSSRSSNSLYRLLAISHFPRASYRIPSKMPSRTLSGPNFARSAV